MLLLVSVDSTDLDSTMTELSVRLFDVVICTSPPLQPFSTLGKLIVWIVSPVWRNNYVDQWAVLRRKETKSLPLASSSISSTQMMEGGGREFLLTSSL